MTPEKLATENNALAFSFKASTISPEGMTPLEEIGGRITGLTEIPAVVISD